MEVSRTVVDNEGNFKIAALLNDSPELIYYEIQKNNKPLYRSTEFQRVCSYAEKTNKELEIVCFYQFTAYQHNWEMLMNAVEKLTKKGFNWAIESTSLDYRALVYLNTDVSFIFKSDKSLIEPIYLAILEVINYLDGEVKS